MNAGDDALAEAMFGASHHSPTPAVSDPAPHEPCAKGTHCCCCGPGDTCCDCGDTIAQPPVERLVIAAAQGAATAAAELLRFAREGEISHQFPFEPETIEQIADALKMVIEIERPAAERRHDMVDELDQLQAAIAKFLDGWA